MSSGWSTLKTLKNEEEEIASFLNIKGSRAALLAYLYERLAACVDLFSRTAVPNSMKFRTFRELPLLEVLRRLHCACVILRGGDVPMVDLPEPYAYADIPPSIIANLHEWWMVTHRKAGGLEIHWSVAKRLFHMRTAEEAVVLARELELDLHIGLVDMWCSQIESSQLGGT